MGGVFSSTDDAGDYNDAGEYDASTYADAGGYNAKGNHAYRYQSCSRSDLHNSNNDCYWRAHGYKERPSDVGNVHASYSNANNPNNSTYGSPAKHPNDHAARR